MKHNIYLDYIRGLSALAVMLYHYTTRYDMLFGHQGDYPIYIRYGSYGVLVFFLLSGYLSFSNIEKNAPKEFAVKRFLRLYPSYWIALCLTMLTTFLYLPELSVSIKDFFLNFTMIQMILGVPNVDGAYWTLCCELAFYCFVWMILKSKMQKFSEHIVLIWIFVQIVILIIPNQGTFSTVKKLNDLLYFHCFMAGGLLSMIEKRFVQKPFAGKQIIWIACLLCALCFFVIQQFIAHEQSSGWFFVTAIIIVSVAIIANRENWSMGGVFSVVLRPLVFIASISYPFYLLHQNIGYAIIRKLESSGCLSEWFLLIPFALIVLGAWLLHRFVEISLEKYRKKILSR